MTYFLPLLCTLMAERSGYRIAEMWALEAPKIYYVVIYIKKYSQMYNVNSITRQMQTERSEVQEVFCVHSENWDWLWDKTADGTEASGEPAVPFVT